MRNLSLFLFGPLLVLAWLIPNHYFPWPAFYNDLLAFISILALAITISLTKRPLTLSRSAIFIFLLALVPLLQFASGLVYFLGDALIAAFYLAAACLAVVVGGNLTKIYGPRFMESLAVACLVGALISAVLALHQWLGLPLDIWLMDMPPGGRPYANLAQPNNLATLFGMGLVAAIYLRERRCFGRLVLVLVAFMLLVGVAMTRSRMAFFIMIAITGWIVWGHRRFKLDCSISEAVVGLSVFILSWAGWPTVSEWLYLSADSTVARLGSTFGGEVRLVLWQQLIDAISRQWLVGYGWNQVSVAQVAVAAEYPNSVFAEYSHNLVLDLLVWNGVVLGGAVLAAMGWWFVARIRRASSLESWFALLLISVIGIHGMFELPHAYAYFLLPVGLCIGIIECDSSPSGLRVPRLALVAATFAGLILIGATFSEYKRLERDHRLMRFESAGLERRRPLIKAPDVVMLTQLREFIRFARTEAREGMSEDEIDWMRKVAHRYAYPPALFRYALALGLNRHPHESEIELQRLKQLHPQIYKAARFDWQSLLSKYPQLAQVPFPP